jgi:hypothetical protein
LWMLLIRATSTIAGQDVPTPVFRSRVDAIEIEMRAVDRDGSPVTDLDRSDVEVFEDGRRQQVIAFTRVSVPGGQTANSLTSTGARPDVASNRHVGAGRIYVLILDDLHVDK